MDPSYGIKGYKPRQRNPDDGELLIDREEHVLIKWRQSFIRGHGKSMVAKSFCRSFCNSPDLAAYITGPCNCPFRSAISMSFHLTIKIYNVKQQLNIIVHINFFFSETHCE